MGSGYSMQRTRMVAYKLTRSACAKCCMFLNKQFTGLDELQDDIKKLREFRNEIDNIVSEIDMLFPEGDA